MFGIPNITLNTIVMTDHEKMATIKQLAYSIINDKWSKEKMRHLASTIYGIADGIIVGIKDNKK